jgi:regulator of sigma E protease
VAIRDVVAGAPAAGKLQPGDVVLKIDGQAVDSPKKLRDLIEERAGRDVTLDVKSTRSDGVTELKPVIIRPRTKAERGPNDGALGVRPYVPADKVTTVHYVNGVGPLQAIVAGVQTTFRLLVQMLAGLGMLLASLFGFVQAPEGRVGGPILIAQMTGEIGQSEGLLSLISWTGLLSVNLALFNLLPIPALDGSRIVFALIEWIRGGKRVPPEREAMVHAIGMVLLLGLMLVISIADVRFWLRGINALGG